MNTPNATVMGLCDLEDLLPIFAKDTAQVAPHAIDVFAIVNLHDLNPANGRKCAIFIILENLV